MKRFELLVVVNLFDVLYSRRARYGRYFVFFVLCVLMLIVLFVFLFLCVGVVLVLFDCFFLFFFMIKIGVVFIGFVFSEIYVFIDFKLERAAFRKFFLFFVV